MNSISLATLCIVASFSLLHFLRGIKAVFPLLLLISTIYYSLGGYWYWIFIEDGYFVGLDWRDSLAKASNLFALASFLVITSYFFAIHALKVRSSSDQAQINYIPHNGLFKSRSFITLHLLGLAASILVIFSSESRGPLFLIAYQFSDILVATVLFSFALQPRSPFTLLSLIYFIAYCIFVGFRYKLAILAWPILLLIFLTTKGPRRWIYSIVLPFFLLVGFSVITFTRVKFSGLDFASVEQIDTNKLLYGLFAETNLLFGVISIIEYVLPTYPLTYFAPLLDTFLELIPRALLPQRETGTQIYYVLEGLQSQEGFNSGTTYPFFGEYLMAFGYPGFLFGCILFGSIAAKLTAICSHLPTYRLVWVGCGLVSSLLGYYYVSRGYFPQFSKSIIFILIPYLFLCKKVGAKS